MKIPLKLKEHAFRYLYLLVFLANIVLMFVAYNFVNEYVYNAVAADKSLIEAQARQAMEDIDLDKFKAIVKKLEQKTEH